MKIILTGATGFIGSEVLRQCLQNPSITLITVITRRPLPDELGSPKIRQVICRGEFEWLEWGPSMMRWVDDSEACIWCIGGLPKCFSSPAAYLNTTTTLPLTAARAFSPLASLERKFRFLYLSTYNADVTESKWRALEKTSAYLKGRTEHALCEMAKNHPLQVQYELYTFRPGSVLDRQGEITRNGFGGRVGRLCVPTVPVGVLARTMIDVALNGYGESAVSVFFENKEILAKGYELEEREAEKKKRQEVEEMVGPQAGAMEQPKNEGKTVKAKPSFVRRITGEEKI